jgi:four helix bundle protein
MNLDDLRVYNISMQISEKVWQIVATWDYFSKDTVGKQLMRACDSISANLSEGFGRYSYKEEKQFSYYARGSLYETKTWLAKAKNRKLISEEDFEKLNKEINDLAIKLNNYIKSIGKKATE